MYKMLVLTRQENELVMTGNNIELAVLAISNGSIHSSHVRLVITAPKRIPVSRREIWETIQPQKKRHAVAGNKVVNSKPGDNQVETCGKYNTNKERAFARVTELASGIPV